MDVAPFGAIGAFFAVVALAAFVEIPQYCGATHLRNNLHAFCYKDNRCSAPGWPRLCVEITSTHGGAVGYVHLAIPLRRQPHSVLFA
jgi:hypothetical protein